MFYSADTGHMICGLWMDGILDGPCNVVLDTGRQPYYTNLVFRQNVLYGTESPSPAANRRTSRIPAYRGCRLPKRNEIHQRTMEHTETMAYDLSGHVRRIADKCTEGAAQISLHRADSATAVTDYSEPELQAAELALGSCMDQLRNLYEAFSADGGSPVIVYRTLMTRFGLWRMLIGCGLHAQVSLADFDELLCKYDQVHPKYYLSFSFQQTFSIIISHFLSL